MTLATDGLYNAKALGDVLPRNASHDAPNSLLADLKESANLSLCQIARAIDSTYVAHLLGGKFICPPPPLADAVIGILLRCPEKQMIRAHAQSIIASVADKKIVGNWPDVEPVGPTMSAFTKEQTIAVRGRPIPLPATLATIRNAPPKFFHCRRAAIRVIAQQRAKLHDTVTKLIALHAEWLLAMLTNAVRGILGAHRNLQSCGANPRSLAGDAGTFRCPDYTIGRG